MHRTLRAATTCAVLLLLAGCGGTPTDPGSSLPAGPEAAEEVRGRTVGAGAAAMERSLAGGRWSVFHTRESLDPEDVNGTHDVYLRDLETGEVTLISRGGNRASSMASLSAEGNRIAYASDATNLVPGDTNGRRDIFLFDRTTGLTERVSLSSTGAQGTGTSTWPALSSDGTLVAWVTEGRLVPSKTTSAVDVWLRDLTAGTTTHLTPGLSGTGGNAASSAVALSGDGRFVAFVSAATNLVPGDTNGAADVFLLDRQSGVTERVSVGPGGIQANGACANPTLSDDGRRVAWDSTATTLAAGDTNGRRDVFLRDRQAGTTTLVTLGGNGDSTFPTLSRDGLLLAFGSLASNLVAGDSNGVSDVLWLPLEGGALRRASAGDQPTWDAEAAMLLFRTASSTLQAVDLSPGAPTGLSATAQGSEVLLQWTAVVGAESYEVSLQGSETPLTTVSGTSATVSLADGSYDFVVRARNAAGLSAPSDPASAVVSSGPAAWAGAGGSSTSSSGYSAAVGPDGTRFVAGAFNGTATFGTAQVTSAGGTDAFVMALEPSGSVRWVARGGGTAGDTAYAVAAHGSRVFVVGSYSHDTSTGFLSGLGATAGGQEAFVVALDAADGSVLWKSRTGGSNNDLSLGVAAGPSAVIVSGGYTGTPTGFASSAGVSAGAEDGFLAALAPATGAPLWAKRTGGTNADRCNGVALDAAGAYVTGYYNLTMTGFASSAGASAGNNEVFVARLDLSTGNTTWARRFGSTGSDYGASVAVTPSNVLAGGYYTLATTGIASLPAATGVDDAYVLSLDPSTGATRWAVRGGGSGSDGLGLTTSLAADASKVYVIGYYQDTPTGFLADAGPVAGGYDVYVAALNLSDGSAAWVRRSGGSGSDHGRGVAVDGAGIFVTGTFQSVMSGFASGAGASPGTTGTFWANLLP